MPGAKASTVPASGFAAATAVQTRTDSHAHVIALGRKLIAERHSAPSREANVTEYLQVLDAHGICRGVLTAPSFYGDDNSVLLEALDQAPDRLRGTVIVGPSVPLTTLRAMGRRNVVGIRLNWLRRTTLPDVRSPEFLSLLHKIRELDWHVEIYLEGPKLANILPHLIATGVKTVVDHFGSPDPALGQNDPGFQAVLRGLTAGRTWVKLSGPFRLGQADAVAYARALLEAGGAERLLFGSDWPWVGHEAGRCYQDCLDCFESWIGDPEQRERILCSTPAALFNFPSPYAIDSGSNGV